MLFFGDIERLPYRSSVRSHVQTTGTKDPNVHRYVIACEISRAKGAVELADTIRRLSSQWEHPLSGLWVVETTFKAQDIRSALLSHMEPQDRLFITEAGQDKAEVERTAWPAGRRSRKSARSRSSPRYRAGTAC